MKTFLPNGIFLLLSVTFALVLTGCFEDRTHITINEDGSAIIESQITIADRLVVAMEESEKKQEENGGGPSMSMSMGEGIPFTEEKLREELGENVEIQEITVEDQEDGSRVISFTAKVPDIAQYLEEQDENSLQNFRIVQLDETTGALLWEGFKQEGNMNLGLAETYALAKGLYMQHTISMPVALETDTGELSDDDKTVTWTFDLRNREGLARTRQMQEKIGDSPGRASFPLSALNVDLPRISATAVTQQAPAGMTTSETDADGSGLNAQIAALTVTRAKAVADDATLEKLTFYHPREDALELRIALLWNEESKPAAAGTPVLDEITTDTGANLLPDDEGFQHESEVDEDDKAASDTVTAKAPPKDATALAVVRGHYPVIAGTDTRLVTVDKPLEKIGEGKIDDPALMQVGGYIKTIEGSTVQVFAKGKTIEEVILVKAGGERVKGGGGWSSFDDNYTFNFNYGQPVEAGDKLEIRVRLSENRVQVPFEARNVPLP